MSNDDDVRRAGVPSEREPGQEENRSAKKIVKPAMMEKIKIVKKKKKKKIEW